MWFGQRMMSDVFGAVSLNSFTLTFGVDAVVQSILDGDLTAPLVFLLHSLVLHRIRVRHHVHLSADEKAIPDALRLRGRALDWNQGGNGERLVDLLGVLQSRIRHVRSPVAAVHRPHSRAEHDVGDHRLVPDINSTDMGSASFHQPFPGARRVRRGIGHSGPCRQVGLSRPGAQSGSVLMGMIIRKGLAGPKIPAMRSNAKNQEPEMDVIKEPSRS